MRSASTRKMFSATAPRCRFSRLSYSSAADVKVFLGMGSLEIPLGSLGLFSDAALFFDTFPLIGSTPARAITVGIRHFAVTFSIDRGLASSNSNRSVFAGESVSGRTATT